MGLEDSVKITFDKYQKAQKDDATFKKDPLDRGLADKIGGAYYGRSLQGHPSQAALIRYQVEDNLEDALKEVSELNKEDVYKQIVDEVKPEFEGEIGLNYWIDVANSLEADSSKFELSDAGKKYVAAAKFGAEVAKASGTYKQDPKQGFTQLTGLLNKGKKLSEREVGRLARMLNAEVYEGAFKLALQIQSKEMNKAMEAYLTEVEKDGKKEKVIDEKMMANDIKGLQAGLENYVTKDAKAKDILYKSLMVMAGTKQAIIKQLEEAKKKAEEEAKKAKK